MRAFAIRPYRLHMRSPFLRRNILRIARPDYRHINRHMSFDLIHTHTPFVFTPALSKRSKPNGKRDNSDQPSRDSHSLNPLIMNEMLKSHPGM
jgi:hypothetical protein